uniref:Uncharacterized protein n=1 Tax=Knipowitschia caucasica TaxID=637954 RepID=A0AAV2J493_KNICA
MGRPECCLWWALLLFLSLEASAEPQFVVVLPAVVESGTAVRFCLSLLQVSEELSVSVSLQKGTENTLLYKETHNDDTNKCSNFQAPVVKIEKIAIFEVEVEGKNFHKQVETRKILIKNHSLKTFIQTDKPLYLPGQTVHFRVVTLDSSLRPALGLYQLIQVTEPQQNRVAQWLDQTSQGGILQLSYELDPQAKEGFYRITVTKGSEQLSHTFQVEKYVLPKFSVDLEAPADVSVALEPLSFRVCAKYLFGQSVPGSVTLDLCRFFELPRYGRRRIDQQETFPLCHKETQQTSSDGCASFSVQTAQFQNDSRMHDEYVLKAVMTEEGTGLQQAVEKRVKLSFEVGKVKFVNPPKRFHPGDQLDLQTCLSVEAGP